MCLHWSLFFVVSFMQLGLALSPPLGLRRCACHKYICPVLPDVAMLPWSSPGVLPPKSVMLFPVPFQFLPQPGQQKPLHHLWQSTSIRELFIVCRESGYFRECHRRCGHQPCNCGFLLSAQHPSVPRGGCLSLKRDDTDPCPGFCGHLLSGSAKGGLGSGYQSG